MRPTDAPGETFAGWREDPARASRGVLDAVAHGAGAADAPRDGAGRSFASRPGSA